MAKKKDYGNEDIVVLKGPDKVRKRPAVIFGSDGIDGCQHSAFEIISNSIDEAREGYGNKIVVTLKGGNINFTTNSSTYTKGHAMFTPDFTGYNDISINYGDTTDSTNIDGVGIVDLTAAFGAGNEPSVSWCNSNINYFDGSMVVYK